jgi:muconolactone delta-isomerase
MHPRASMDAPVPVGQFAIDAVERVRAKAAAPRRAIALRGRITRGRICAGRSSSAAGTQRRTSDNTITCIAVQGDNA